MTHPHAATTAPAADRPGTGRPVWTTTEVTSPTVAEPVPVVAAIGLPYIVDANSRQTLDLYLPRTPQTEDLVGTAVRSLPGRGTRSDRPRYYVHVHGGAWRDPQLSSSSIEPTVAHLFSQMRETVPLSAVASIDYTVTKFPNHPVFPYDPVRDNHTEPAREAVHPQHVSDVLHGLNLLAGLGVESGSYVLSGHSCGACISFQSILQPPEYWGLSWVPAPPVPAALLGLNGLYDLPDLVHGLGASHEHLSDDYRAMLSNAFGPDERRWPAYSPPRFDPDTLAQRVAAGAAPSLVVLDESPDDQLVPTNQRDTLHRALDAVPGLDVRIGHRCTGAHAAPWQQGDMIAQTLHDVFDTW